jgi:hypothetical protein
MPQTQCGPFNRVHRQLLPCFDHTVEALFYLFYYGIVLSAQKHKKFKRQCSSYTTDVLTSRPCLLCPNTKTRDPALARARQTLLAVVRESVKHEYLDLFYFISF